MPEHDLILGFRPEDFSQILEMSAYLGTAIAIILFIINPLIHMAFATLINLTNISTSPKPTNPTQNRLFLAEMRSALEFMKQNYSKSLRATLFSSLLVFVLSACAIIFLPTMM